MTMLVMGWSVLVLAMTLAMPARGPAVFAYITNADELTRPPVLELRDIGSWELTP